MAVKEKYINLFTDFGFKRVFGEEANKDILMDFLNQVLPVEYTIQDLHFSKNDHLGTTAENRKAIFDIYCVSNKGEHFIVELQKARQDFFKDRSVYYASFPIQEMAMKGDDDWNYELQPVFTVGILNFAFKEGIEDKEKFHHHVQLKDQDCKVFYEKLHFIYLELSKFTKSLSECKTHFEKWLWIFKNLPNLEDIPVDLKEDIFLKLFKITEFAKLGKAEREAYQESVKYLRDLHNVINTAFKEGEQIGLEKGEQIGLEKGIEKGEYKKNVIGIRNMAIKKYSLMTIIEILGVKKEYVQQIQKDLKKEKQIIASLIKQQTYEQIAKQLKVSVWLVEVIAELQNKKPLA